MESAKALGEGIGRGYFFDDREGCMVYRRFAPLKISDKMVEKEGLSRQETTGAAIGPVVTPATSSATPMTPGAMSLL